jgi:hypothetical protein
MEALSGEVLRRDAAGAWRTVRLGDVRVTDRRSASILAGDPLGLSEEQRRVSDWRYGMFRMTGA